MKRQSAHLLDRLLARQRRLLDALEPPQRQQAVRAAARRTPEQLDAARAAESAAIEAATPHLLSGDLTAAAVQLEPHVATATLTQTLTTRARIHMLQGELDDAERLLKRAEALDPDDEKVWYFAANLYRLSKNPVAELGYRRRAAFSRVDMPADNFVALVGALLRATPDGRKPPLSEIRLALEKIRLAPDAAASTHLALAKTLFERGVMVEKALEHYRIADPCPTGCQDVEAQWRSLAQWCEALGLPLQRDLEGGTAGHRPALAELRDVVVHPRLQWIPVVDEGRVALSGFAPDRLGLRMEDARNPMLLRGPASVVLRLPEQIETVERPALLIGGSGRYDEDVVTFIGALAIAEALGADRDLALVVNADLQPHQAELLSLLGYPKERWLRVDPDRPVRFERLIVPTRPNMGRRWVDPALAQWYRNRLVGDGPSGGRRLYVNAPSEQAIANDAEVTELLAQRGYEAIDPTTMTVRERIAAFSQASHLVGPAAAAMASAVFAPAGTPMTMLVNRHHDRGELQTPLQALVAACGHKVRTLECAPVRIEQGHAATAGELHVPPARLLDLVQ